MTPSAPLGGDPVLRAAVMFTGDARHETIARGMSAGAASFIVKPFDREAMRAKLVGLLR